MREANQPDSALGALRTEMMRLIGSREEDETFARVTADRLNPVPL